MTNELTKKVMRKSGILLHPTSFPNKYGIGDLGPSSYTFIDFLGKSGQKLWQVLPLGPTGYGDSPYQAFSSFAGQPLVISPEKLIEEGLLFEEDFSNMPKWELLTIDYGPAINYKFSILRKAFTRFQALEPGPLKTAFERFCEKETSWLLDYALFMAIKDAHGGVIWTSWDREIAFPTPDVKKKWFERLKDHVLFYEFIQFLFYSQWNALKDYAHAKDIQVIGDIPIFVAFDSADVWAHKDLFYLDEEGLPTIVAGVPPDYFSETGQLWGNPLYDWAVHKKTNYTWWIDRVSHCLKLVDILRIDHFRGFEAYWSVPYGAPNAIKGEWKKGPFKDLFIALEAALGKDLPIIAEDLGIITPAVEELRDAFHFPGMKILQFAFEDVEENDFLPHNYLLNSVCYSGTHDNDTTVGWYENASEVSRDRVRRYMNTDGREISWDFIRTCFGSVSSMAVVPLQDVLSFGSRFRMNTPGIPWDNWQFRYTFDMLTDALAEKLARVTHLYGRGIPPKIDSAE